MITDIDGRSQIGPDLRPEKLEPYWNEYFEYRNAAPELHEVVEEKFTEELGGVVICCVETDQLFCAPFSAKQKEYATYDTPRCSVGTDKGPVAG